MTYKIVWSTSLVTCGIDIRQILKTEDEIKTYIAKEKIKIPNVSIEIVENRGDWVTVECTLSFEANSIERIRDKIKELMDLSVVMDIFYVLDENKTVVHRSNDSERAYVDYL